MVSEQMRLFVALFLCKIRQSTQIGSRADETAAHPVEELRVVPQEDAVAGVLFDHFLVMHLDAGPVPSVARRDQVAATEPAATVGAQEARAEEGARRRRCREAAAPRPGAAAAWSGSGRRCRCPKPAVRPPEGQIRPWRGVYRQRARISGNSEAGWWRRRPVREPRDPPREAVYEPEERGNRKKRSGAHVLGGNRGPPVLGALGQNLVSSTKW